MLPSKIKSVGLALLVVCLLGAMGVGLVSSTPAQQPGRKKTAGKLPGPPFPLQTPGAATQPEDPKKLQQEIERLQKENDDLRKQKEILSRVVRDELAQKKLDNYSIGQDSGMSKPPRLEKPRPGNLIIKVYPVASLTGPSAVEGFEARSLMRVLTNTIDPSSWKEMGGEGSMEYYAEGGCLVIRQTPEAQQQVRDLLDMLRRAKKEHDSSPQGG
jgi:hypothetical protein